MAKVSPAVNNFNAGEFSPLVAFRTDIDRYPAAMRTMSNFIAAPQGPAIRRSGTYFQHNALRNDKHSHLVPFIFSDEQANALEFGHHVMRVLSIDGVLTYGNRAVTATVAGSSSSFTFTSAALVLDGTVIGDQVALAGFGYVENVNGKIATVTLVAGNDVTVNCGWLGAIGAPVGAPTASRVFSLATTYDSNDVRSIVAVQSIDIVYLFCNGYKTRKLSRISGLNWTIADVEYIDGPYLDENILGGAFTPNGTGNAIEFHTADVGANGTASASSTDAGVAPWMAFDRSLVSEWRSNGNAQNETLFYTFNSAKVIEGYTVWATQYNTDSSNPAAVWRPVTWVLEGSNDGVTWDLLDSQYGYALWQNYRTQYLKINNSVAYTRYRLHITALEGAGSLVVRVARLAMREHGSQSFNITASSIAQINRGLGFRSTDVGRLIRVYQKDNFWRSLKIIGRTSPTVVTVELQDEPLVGTDAILRWRLGAWSDTTGWPVTGGFWNDRMWQGGAFDNPTLIGGSAPQSYEKFSPTDPNGTVSEDNGLSFTPRTRNAAPLRWMVPDDQGLVLGYGSSEWLVKPSTENQTFSARNARAVKSTERGSASMQPVVVDNQILWVPASQRTLREYAYALSSDGFKSPSMSLFASHLGVSRFFQLAYAADPHSIAWVRRADGTLVGLTYNREENVIGWHKHSFGGDIESMCVIPNPNTFQDELWLVVRRTIDGADVRYIERLTAFWDFNNTLASAYYVDCGLRVTFAAPTTEVYGLWFLEGEQVWGKADNVKVGYDTVLTVVDGHVTLPFECSSLAIGKKFLSYAETVNTNAGAAEGTAQGKVKRINNVTVAVWDSYGGEIGVYNDDQKIDEFLAIPYREDELADPALQTAMIGPFTPAQGYGKRGSLIFQTDDPYPLNILALYPQHNTQDR